MTRAICLSCGLSLDPDAPGAACAVCHGESPSPTARPAPRSALSNLGSVLVIATQLASDEGRELDASDLDLAAQITRSPVQA